jgi:2-polyprenyl-3-methyl-5-hydroxy-6-metoxy-1,4-benzoquinol methylase
MSFQEKQNSSCPVCGNTSLGEVLNCTDFSLTQEQFDIIECPNCTLKVTSPIPPADKIAPYYNFTDYISHTDINEGWMNKLYHKVRKRTLTQKTNWIQSLFTGFKGNLLEIGAGTGAFANAMQLKGWKVTALEPDEITRSRAKDNYNLELLPIEALYHLPENSFDVITLWHVLEHVHDLNGYFKAVQKLLKPNGRLIIAVPNYTSFDAQYYQSYWAAYDVPRHLYHFNPKSMAALSHKYSFRIVDTIPMWFDSFYVSLLSEKYRKSGYFGVLRAFVIGIISNLLAFRINKRASSIIYEIKHN